MANGAIETVLWPGAKAEVGADLLNGGIHVNKGGYHSDRNWLRQNKPNDYSIQEPPDKLGPGDLGSAIDLTFNSARGGNFSNIAKYSRRLLEAGQRKDPRAYPLREFQGNIDSDRTVEGWSFYRDHALTTSDLSHLWHIHLSIWRKYINDAAAMRSILSIWKGEEEEEDMPTAKDVWTTYQLGAPQPYATDDHNWQPATYLRKIAEGDTPQGKRIDALDDKVKALDAKLDAILAAVSAEPPTP